MVPAIVAAAIAPLPKVPSLTCDLQNPLQTTATNEDTTTWTTTPIGTPHKKRMVICAVYKGVNAVGTCRINGVMATPYQQFEWGIFAANIPNGEGNAEFVITATTSLRKALRVYIFYPNNHMALDSGQASATTTNDAIVADMKVQAGGCLVYCGGQHATAGTPPQWATTWSGTDAPTEDDDAALEGAATFTNGRISQITISSDLDDLTMAESTSGTKRLNVATWGPPPPGN